MQKDGGGVEQQRWRDKVFREHFPVIGPTTFTAFTDAAAAMSDEIMKLVEFLFPFFVSQLLFRHL